MTKARFCWALPHLRPQRLLSRQGSFFSGQFVDAGKGATIIGHQNVQNHLMALKTASEGWPSDTFVQSRRRKFHNGEAIEIFHMPNAVTDADSIVHFRHSDLDRTSHRQK